MESPILVEEKVQVFLVCTLGLGVNYGHKMKVPIFTFWKIFEVAGSLLSLGYTMIKMQGCIIDFYLGSS